MEANCHHTSLGDIRYWVSRIASDKPWLVFLPGLSAVSAHPGKDLHFYENSITHFFPFVKRFFHFVSILLKYIDRRRRYE